jgi:hypothetical protein
MVFVSPAADPRSGPASCLFEFREQLEPPERVAPHLLEDGGHRRQRRPAGAVEAMPPLHADVDETCLGEAAELTRHGTGRDVGHRLADGAGCPLALPHDPQNLEAARRGDDREGSGVEHNRHLRIN